MIYELRWPRILHSQVHEGNTLTNHTHNMPSEASRRRARKANAESFAGTPFRPAHQHGERAKRKGKRKAAADGQESDEGSGEEDDLWVPLQSVQFGEPD
jgi:hypothetical protein